MFRKSLFVVNTLSCSISMQIKVTEVKVQLQWFIAWFDVKSLPNRQKFFFCDKLAFLLFSFHVFFAIS